ncbi:MAG: hypothetical protein KGH96_05775 [Sphingomonadales bacterium]|nr:hypothetical protein [Sphingomonadales bacterium]
MSPITQKPRRDTLSAMSRLPYAKQGATPAFCAEIIDCASADSTLNRFCIGMHRQALRESASRSKALNRISALPVPSPDRAGAMVWRMH